MNPGPEDSKFLHVSMQFLRKNIVYFIKKNTVYFTLKLRYTKNTPIDQNYTKNTPIDQNLNRIYPRYSKMLYSRLSLNVHLTKAVIS
jgi:hypothetical protein